VETAFIVIDDEDNFRPGILEVCRRDEILGNQSAGFPQIAKNLVVFCDWETEEISCTDQLGIRMPS